MGRSDMGVEPVWNGVSSRPDGLVHVPISPLLQHLDQAPRGLFATGAPERRGRRSRFVNHRDSVIHRGPPDLFGSGPGLRR